METSWRQRIRRAEQLAAQHAFAAEILRFYIPIARFQESLYRQLQSSSWNQGKLSINDLRFAIFGAANLSVVFPDFASYLTLVEEHGPQRLAEAARHLQNSRENSRHDLLNAFWSESDRSPALPEEFLAFAFLQPYAEFVRSLPSTASSQIRQRSYALCPFCNRKPALGVMRQLGDGGRRNLLCGFCLAEWGFRRIVCPGCGEEDNQKLPVYTASDFAYIRVECCDTCKTYLKSIDLTKNGLADPVVDEIGSAPLDLWAQERGYSKLQLNLLGI